LQPHCVDGVEERPSAARQPAPEIKARNPRQHRQHREPTALTLHARRVAISAEQATGFERRERAAITVLSDAVEDHVETACQDTRKVLALVVDRRGTELADQRGVPPMGSTPHLKPGHTAKYEQRLTDCTGSSMDQYALPSLHLSGAVQELIRGHPAQ